MPAPSDPETTSSKPYFPLSKIREVNIAKTTATTLPIKILYDFGRQLVFIGTLPALSVQLFRLPANSTSLNTAGPLTPFGTLSLDPLTFTEQLQRYAFSLTFTSTQPTILQSQVLGQLLAGQNFTLVVKGSALNGRPPNILNQILAELEFDVQVPVNIAKPRPEMIRKVLGYVKDINVAGAWPKSMQVNSVIRLPFASAYLPNLQLPRVQIDLQMGTAPEKTVLTNDLRGQSSLWEYSVSIQTVLGMARGGTFANDTALTEFYSRLLGGRSANVQMRLAFESFAVQVPLTLPANLVTKPLVTVNERSEQTGCIAALFVNNPFPFAVAVSSVSLAADNATTAFTSFRPESSVPVVVERFSSQRFALTMRACPNAIGVWEAAMDCPICSEKRSLYGQISLMVQDKFPLRLRFSV